MNRPRDVEDAVPYEYRTIRRAGNITRYCPRAAEQAALCSSVLSGNRGKHSKVSDLIMWHDVFPLSALGEFPKRGDRSVLMISLLAA